jgi:CRP-like cAMP-binding protein
MTRPLKSVSSSSIAKRTPLLQAPEIPAGLVAEIVKQAKPHFPPASSVLYNEDERPRRLFYLTKGEITFAVRSASGLVDCFRVGRDSLLGLSAVVGKKPYAMTATASEDAEIGQISSKEFLQLIESRPDLYLNVLQVLAAETLSVHKAVAEMLSAD